MSGASIVYADTGLMLLRPPGRIVYHRQDRARSEWPVYVPDPEHPGSSMRTGRERHQTACGQLVYCWCESDERPVRGLDAIRLDHARLIGRPCRRCFR